MIDKSICFHRKTQGSLYGVCSHLMNDRKSCKHLRICFSGTAATCAFRHFDRVNFNFTQN